MKAVYLIINKQHNSLALLNPSCGFVMIHYFSFDPIFKLRKEKVDLENALEQEQESLVNRLWKKMEKLEKEKR